MRHPNAVPRVLQIILSLNPGGTERLVLEIARRLHPIVPMAVCCLDRPGSWARELEAVGIGVTALGRLPGFHPLLGRSIATIARRHQATLLHAHHYSPFVYAALARFWSPSSPVVFTEHGRVSASPPSPKRRLANRVLFSRVPSRVFAVSEDLRQHIVAEGFGERQVEVIYNGIDVGAPASADIRATRRAELGADDATFVVGTVARLDPVKDLRTLLEAARLAGRDRRVLLVIVGDGPERATLEAAAAELGIAAAVRFMGHRDDARAWVAACDVFVNSSVSEGVSLTILEAMAAGLPVVVTAVGGTPEVVTDECGILVQPRNAGGLAAAILEIAGRADWGQSLGRAGRHRVETRFTIERMVQEYHDVYRGIA